MRGKTICIYCRNYCQGENYVEYIWKLYINCHHKSKYIVVSHYWYTNSSCQLSSSLRWSCYPPFSPDQDHEIISCLLPHPSHQYPQVLCLAALWHSCILVFPSLSVLSRPHAVLVVRPHTWIAVTEPTAPVPLSPTLPQSQMSLPKRLLSPCHSLIQRNSSFLWYLPTQAQTLELHI